MLDAVVARDHANARAEARGEPVVHVAHRGKIELGHHDGVAPARVVERRQHRRLRDRHVRQHRHLARRRADERRDLVADGHRHVPPAARPGAHPELRPLIDVLGKLVGHAARHCAEGVRHEICRPLENRKFGAERQERIAGAVQ